MSTEPLVEITELMDSVSFCGDSTVSSELFSPSPKCASNTDNQKKILQPRTLFPDDNPQDEIQFPNTLNSPLFTGYDSHSSTPSKCSTRKTEKISNRRRESKSKLRDVSPESPGIFKRFSKSLPPEKLNSMDENDLRDSLQKSLLENSSLLEEVRIKDKAIRRLSQCLNDIEDFSKTRSQRSSSIYTSPPNFQGFSTAPEFDCGDTYNCSIGLINCGRDETPFSFENLGLSSQLSIYSSQVLEEENEIQVIQAQTSTTSLFEEFSTALRDSRPAIEHNVISGTYIAKDVLLGGSVGWLGAYLLKKFGTTALTALTGGIIVIHLAARKGYVIVNWGEIYKEIEKKSEENEEIKNELEWVGDKVNDIKLWIQQHKFVAGGLAISFIYNIFK